jgi:hypothetical protein
MSGVLLYGLYRTNLPLMTLRVLDCGAWNIIMGILRLSLLTRLIPGLTAGGNGFLKRLMYGKNQTLMN